MKKVAVLMSGGVDSTFAAIILKDMGFEVTGVTLNLTGKVPKRAREMAQLLGIKHTVLDLKAEFYEKVISTFVNWYLSGITPNPCSLCNRFIKFGIAFERILAELNVDFVATGHYLGKTEYKGYPVIKEGKDKSKEQSYFLALVKSEALPRLLFPLEDREKREAIETVYSRTGVKYDSRGSQEVCFLEGKSVGAFIRETMKKESIKRGDIIYMGKRVGKHSGIFEYTIGQRRFGLSMGKPLYVIEIDAKNNTVIIGEEELLYKEDIKIGNLNLFVPIQLWEKPTGKIRYRSEKVEIVDIKREGDLYTIKFQKAVRAPTPGQVLAIYEGEYLIGGGIILR
ncbi:MAG: tRNA 2-thiouridine(34) synthase MnmA [Thermosulfidibacteraceae bacterium]